MNDVQRPVIAEDGFAMACRELGPALRRVLGYYRQDGAVSIAAIEDAMRDRDAAAMVLPAHSLKGESRQFGAERLADMAQSIEVAARRAMEQRTALPTELMTDTSQLRTVFHDTLSAIERRLIVEQPESGRVSVASRPVFGRRVTN